MSILIFVILAVISTVVALLYRGNRKRKEEVLPSYRKRNPISPLPPVEGGVTEQELKAWREQKKERYERRKTEEVVYTPRRTDVVDDPDIVVIPIFPIFVDEIAPTFNEDKTASEDPSTLPEEKTEFGGGSFGGAGAEGSWDTKADPGYSYEPDRTESTSSYEAPDTSSYDSPADSSSSDCSPSNNDD